ncbi:hypothetical protein PG999_009469 [Apiospora kogelbergensis]|uniref:Uncharacterized protein n=1 Tax=Apiospora kogelbergensis TaxID=1337665 RepID=A0AAW0QV78_9PEZI
MEEVVPTGCYRGHPLRRRRRGSAPQRRTRLRLLKRWIGCSSRTGLASKARRVRGWEDDGAVEVTTEDTEASHGEDCMKINIGTFDLDLYVDLDNDETWYSFYTPPGSILNE